MPIGPGKYDELATTVREQAHASGVLVIIFDGTEGSGFSAQLPPGDAVFAVPAILRAVADSIDESIRAGSL